MWSNKRFLILVISVLASCVAAQKPDDSVCPVRPNSHVKAVDVYDGPLAEMAILVPDEATDTEGFWNLAYVYEAGRTVNIRCRYSDKTTVDVDLEKEIDQCRYAMAQEELILRCE